MKLVPNVVHISDATIIWLLSIREQAKLILETLNKCFFNAIYFWMSNLQFRTSLIRRYVFQHLTFFTGEGRGRFKASEIVSDPNRKDCYLATLTIADMISSDSRLYFVTIANDRGETRYGINARVCMMHNGLKKILMDYIFKLFSRNSITCILYMAFFFSFWNSFCRLRLFVKNFNILQI